MLTGIYYSYERDILKKSNEKDEKKQNLMVLYNFILVFGGKNYEIY
jgi:hypothetical protein